MIREHSKLDVFKLVEVFKIIMGNQPNSLKDEYNEQAFKAILSHTDSNIGQYQLLKFQNPQAPLYLKRVINPDTYDEFSADWDLLQQKIYQHHENICEFKFIELNNENEDFYDMLFEFGNYLNTSLKSEQLIWKFAEEIMNGLIFLENLNLHFP